MTIAALPADEDQRLEDLYSYDLMDSKPDSDFDDLVDLAGLICGCPISLITLLDKDRQWFKSQKGMDISETSRDLSFCSHAILGNGVMEVTDASKDERFYDNPFVTEESGIRFYAGSPIVSPGGFKLGTICVVDHTPRTLTQKQENALMQLSRQVGRLIEMREKNKLIRKRALEIISIKNDAITQIMQHNWNENKSLAYHLHEGLAQEIAGCLIHLQTASLNKANSGQLLEAVKVQLQQSLAKVKEMSYSIIPVTTDWLPVDELIEEYIGKIAKTFPFAINGSIQGRKGVKASGKTMVLIHIIEAWLTRLAAKKQVTAVSITLNTGKAFELTIEDDAKMDGLHELSDHVYASLLKEMAIAESGRVNIQVSGSGKNSVKITIPFGAVTAKEYPVL